MRPPPRRAARALVSITLLTVFSPSVLLLVIGAALAWYAASNTSMRSLSSGLILQRFRSRYAPLASPATRKVVPEPLRFCRTVVPILYLAVWPALVAPFGRPHRPSPSGFAVDADLAPAAGSTGTAPPECETQSARPVAESPSETGKPSPPPHHLDIANTGRAAVLPLLRRLASGPADNSVDHTSGRFSVQVSGVGLWGGVARRAACR
jgi:hypothetical protein